ncbi:hypothetical protein DB347_16560 [Opitutaceae bacterium EW11]|nr:hypothetical protein DB347_16560 [Opitutaceae bacterium EW11]
MIRSKVRFAPFLVLLVATLAAQQPATDFSHAGYGGGGVPIPVVAGKVEVVPAEGDATARIQAALDAVAAMPADDRGFRGAVVLRSGSYRIEGQLRIRTSGTVLRGENAILVATGQDRRTLIEVASTETRELSSPIAVAEERVPAGARSLKLASLEGIRAGSRLVVLRPSTKAWISELGMDKFTGNFKDARLDWLPGSRDLAWDRTVVEVGNDDRRVTLDAPVTTALDPRWGGGSVQVVTSDGRIRHIGIEGLTCISEAPAGQPLNEDHAWLCISLDRVENAWVRDVTARQFVSTAVWVGAGAKSITVQDCRSEAPVGEPGGWRRLAFYTRGQEVLFQRCRADQAREAFAAGLCSAGPNVFLDCTATHALAASGSFESWASGALFDNVAIEGAGIALANAGYRYQGSGWTAADSVVWNCTAAAIQVENPPGAENQVVTASPIRSLYREQLRLRAGTEALAALDRTDLPREMAALTRVAPKTAVRPPPARTFALQNGRFTVDGAPLFGAASSNAWWKGQTVPMRAAQLGYHPMRWAPGLIGPGMTEDLPRLVDSLASRKIWMMQVWPGLWYDRRRDDHLTVQRPDAETWAPFYEMPWARSGQGQAWDGLSKYDLTRFNPWYFSRLKTAADLASRQGVLLYYHLYNNHNVIEAAAHWADFPWRPANCLQETGFPEPPPYEQDGHRIRIADQFYDVTQPVRRELHRLFIRHSLDELKAYPNVIYTLGFQFAGPLTFQQFFLDTVAEWEKETGLRVRIALNTSKTVTDAILGDPVRGALVDVVDQRYWQYLADGTLFAPHSDGKLAFREMRTEAFGKDAVPPGKPELVYRQVREYRDRWPDKAVFAGDAGQGPVPILMAGGAYPLIGDFAAAQPLKVSRDDRALYQFLRERIGPAWTSLKAVDLPEAQAHGVWTLSDGKSWLLYSAAGDTLALPSGVARAKAWWFSPETGETRTAELSGAGAGLVKPSAGAWLLWVTP